MPEELNLEACQRELRDFYLLEKSKVPLLQWVPGDAKDMSNIFVDPLLIRKEDKKVSKKLSNVDLVKENEKVSNILNNADLVKLKTSEGHRANRVLVVGSVGTGKTTVADNIVYKWAKGTSTVLSEYTLVFIIAMHKIQDRNASLIDLIFQQVLSEDSRVSRNGLKSYTDSHAEEIMLIFDGMDEDSSGTLKNTSSEITKILHNRKLRESCVILTTRPEWVNSLGDQLKNYSQVKIHGYSPQNIDLYIQKYFQGDKQEGASLITEIKGNEICRSLASTPVLLLMMCILWEDHQSLPATKTQLLQNTFLCLWKIYKKKNAGYNSLSDEDLDTDISEDDLTALILKLGRVALYSSGDKQFVFKMSEFERGVLKLGCKVNLINKKSMRVGLKRITYVIFVNILFQYYCAGVYLAKLLETNRAEFDKCLQPVLWFSDDGTSWGFPDILDFCCGSNPKAISPCLKHIIHLYECENQTFCDISLHVGHIFESQLSHEQCEEFIPMYLNPKIILYITQTVIPYMYYIVNLHKTSKHSLLSTLGSLSIETLDNFFLWLPSLLKCTTKLRNLYIKKAGFNSLTIKSDIDKSKLTACFRAIGDLSCLEILYFDNSDNEHMQLDVTKLFQMLYKNRVNLTTLRLLGFQFDLHTMAQFLSNCTALSDLALFGST